MNNYKNYLTVFLTICMIISCLFITAVNAMDVDEGYVVDEIPKTIGEGEESQQDDGGEELLPIMANNCQEYVEGIGWTGSKEWNQAVAKVQGGGDILGWGIANIYLSESQARRLISDAGLTCVRIDPAHEGLDPHNYRHIHYLCHGSYHNTIRIR